MNLDPLREKLIDAMHSNTEAQEFFIGNLNDPLMLLQLCVICAPYDKYSDDPRMEASYYVSKCSAELLVGVLPLLVLLLTPSNEEDMNGNIACHLIRAIEKAKHLSKGTVYLDLAKLKEEYGCL